MSKSMELSRKVDVGFNEIKQKETWENVLGFAFGNFLGSFAVSLTDKLTSNNSRVLRYGAGTLSSGALSIMAFGMKYKRIGYGAAAISATRAINTATSLLFDKSVGELLNNVGGK